MDNKRKHLEMIQAVINRMSGNLFFLKGWTITFVAALITLLVKEEKSSFVFIVFFPVVIFWLLDGYYLSKERQFRSLYDSVRKLREEKIDFSMSTRPFESITRNLWAYTLFSKTLVLFYMSLLVLSALSYYLFK